MLTTLRRPTPLDVSKLIFVGAIWGSAFLFISIALADFGPISVATWRVSLGAAVLMLIALLIGQQFPRGYRTWRLIFIVGLLNSAVPFFLISWGQQFISSAESALLVAMGTFVSLVLSHFSSDDERMNKPRVVGVSVGFVGVLVLVFWDLIESGTGNLPGQLAVMAAGCSYATSSVISRRLTHLPMISTSAVTMASACLYMIPLAFLLGDPLPDDVGLGSIVALVYLGVIATALAFTLRFFIIRANGAVFMSQVGYLVPLFGVIWSGLYFADAINLQTLVSLVMILLGIAITRKGS
ncbi:MAG: DMT family transporter [Gammaproteobacteria bacterium]|nr:MAG: DMT family transporter [Gammaproteobacteria bacterium]